MAKFVVNLTRLLAEEPLQEFDTLEAAKAWVENAQGFVISARVYDDATPPWSGAVAMASHINGKWEWVDRDPPTA